jgi:hypothetical protein
MIRAVIVGLVGGWLLAGFLAPASAWQEGSFASPDGESEVTLRRTAEGGVELALSSPLVGTPLDVTLVPVDDAGVLRRPPDEVSWLGRLMGKEPVPLPFDGERLVFARTEDEAFVVSTLDVDRDGRPTYLRLALAPAGDGMHLRVRRFDEAGLEALGPVELQRTAP